MIYLSGAIRIATEQELMREAEVYAQRGWTLKDPTTHNVSITLDEDDLDAFASYLQQRPRDKRLRIWTDRHGVQHEARTVTFYLKGTEMAGNWVRLRASVGSQPTQLPDQPAPAPDRPRAAPPIRRTPAAATPAPSMAWATTPNQPPSSSAESDDYDDIPF